MNNIFDVIFPNHTCLVCGGEINKNEHKFICNTCSENLPFHKNVCDKCGCEISMHAIVCDRCKGSVSLPAGLSAAPDMRRSSSTRWNFSKARSAFCYASPVDELVLRLKYNAHGDVAKFAVPFLAETAASHNVQADIIIPVPLAPKRAKQRGYNQAALIAAELSKIMEIPVADDVLVRVRHTDPQKKMSPSERAENLRGAFEIKPPYSAIKGKRVLLVDDVFTTGATTNECAQLLRRAKPKSIEVLTIASVSQQPKDLIKQSSQKPVAKAAKDSI